MWTDCVIVIRFQWMSGRLAEMVERPLRMREVGGSIPPVSTLYSDTTDVSLTALRRSHVSLDTYPSPFARNGSYLSVSTHKLPFQARSTSV